MSQWWNDLWATTKWFGPASIVLCGAAGLRARREGIELLQGEAWNWPSVVLPLIAVALLTLLLLSLLRPSIQRLWGSLLAGWIFAAFAFSVMAALLNPHTFAERTIVILGLALALGAVLGPLFAFCVWLGLFAE